MSEEGIDRISFAKPYVTPLHYISSLLFVSLPCNAHAEGAIGGLITGISVDRRTPVPTQVLRLSGWSGGLGKCMRIDEEAKAILTELLATYHGW